MSKIDNAASRVASGESVWKGIRLLQAMHRRGPTVETAPFTSEGSPKGVGKGFRRVVDSFPEDAAAKTLPDPVCGAAQGT